MKKFLMMFYVALVCATVFNSCSKDDDNDPQSQIIGKWQYSTAIETIDGKVVTGSAGDPKYVEAHNGVILEFNSDLTLTSKKGDVLIGSGTYTISEGAINIKSGNESDSWIFTISNNKLHLYTKSEDPSSTYKTEFIYIKIQ